MNPLWTIPQGLITLWINRLTKEQREKYEAAVDAQIAEGRAAREAQISAVQRMIQENPHTQAAQTILNFQKQHAFGDIAPTKAEWNRREKDVMGYLEGIGTQAKKDINRTFGEEAGMVQSNLVTRGLSGGGVGASIAHGFATRKADALARSEENVGQMKAETLSGLRADTQIARERALERAYGQGTNYADFEGGWGVQGTDAFLDTTNRYIDDIYGVNNVPPDEQANINAWQNLGTLGGRFGD